MHVADQIQRAVGIAVALGALLLVATGSLLSQTPQKDEETSSEACTASAWDLYNRKDYSGAAKKARSCVYFFQGKANAQEKEMDGKTVPPIGEVSETEKQNIVKRGQLNDVATCYFIVGSSYERLYLRKVESGSKKNEEDKNAAVEAYKAACAYKYARTMETNKKSFWSPAEESSYALQRLGSQCP